jgi:hypothetical protein
MTPFRRYQFEDHNGHLVEVITRTITQQDIAAAAGTTLHSVSRTLSA